MGTSECSDRQDVRVPVFFPMRWRPAESAEDLSAEIENHRTCDRFSVPPTAFSDLPSDLTDIADFQEMEPLVYTMWMSLERKLDHVIRMIDQKTFDDPEMEQGHCVNISAGGACIRFMREVAVGDCLQVRFTPPTFPLFIVEIFAKVKSVKQTGENKGEWLASISFETINYSDREDLITYIFKRQREILRTKSD